MPLNEAVKHAVDECIREGILAEKAYETKTGYNFDRMYDVRIIRVWQWTI
jgi:hypothetical protein